MRDRDRSGMRDRGLLLDAAAARAEVGRLRRGVNCRRVVDDRLRVDRGRGSVDGRGAVRRGLGAQDRRRRVRVNAPASCECGPPARCERSSPPTRCVAPAARPRRSPHETRHPRRRRSRRGRPRCGRASSEPVTALRSGESVRGVATYGGTLAARAVARVVVFPEPTRPSWCSREPTRRSRRRGSALRRCRLPAPWPALWSGRRLGRSPARCGRRLPGRPAGRGGWSRPAARAPRSRRRPESPSTGVWPRPIAASVSRRTTHGERRRD